MAYFERNTTKELQKVQGQANPLVFGKYKNDKFEWKTYEQFAVNVENLKKSLIHDLNVQKGDRIAVISRNSTEWAISAYGTYAAGGVYVPMYENQDKKDWSYVIQDSGSSVVFCSTVAIRDKVKSLMDAGEIKGVKHLFCHETDFSALIDGQHALANDPQLVETDLCGIIYTSGTSGKPKGVELSHGNITSNVEAICYHFQETIQGKRVLSFLPWAHAYAQTVELHAGVRLGLEIAVCGGLDVLRQNLVQAQPHVLFSVPSLFEKLYTGIHSNVAKQPPLKQKLFQAAVEVARERARLKRYGNEWKLPITKKLKFRVLDKLVLSKIRAAMGPNLEIAVSGGAKLDVNIMEFFEALGLNVYEGYGLTETSPILAANHPKFKREGTVGRPLPGVRVTIRDPSTLAILPTNEEGEVCGSGPNVFQRYHNLPKETEEACFVDSDGERTFRTGDLGKLTEEGALVITGRIKEQYKLRNGKFVVPTVVEAAIGRSRFVEQCFVHGDNLPSNVAVIVPNWVNVLEKLGLPANEPREKLISSKAVQALLSEEVMRECKDLKHYEIPAHVIVSPFNFTVENGMATPKMSLRRKQILSAFGTKIEGAVQKD